MRIKKTKEQLHPQTYPIRPRNEVVGVCSSLAISLRVEEEEEEEEEEEGKDEELEEEEEHVTTISRSEINGDSVV